jgi:feruloyl-CoA synthase
MDSILQVPFKPIEYLSRDILTERRDDGTLVIQSKHALTPYERHVPALLAHWAREGADRVWLAQRRGPGRDWLKVTYAEAKTQVDAATQWLLDRGFGPDRPIMILSSNSIEFALLTMAAMQARAPVAPVSPAYSVMSRDHAKLKYVFDLIKPGLVFVQNGEVYADALAALDLDGVLVVHVDRAPPRRQSVPWTELTATPATAAVDASIDSIGAKTVAKYLFTSGSTGMPKAVINTQEMMCANIAMMRMGRVRKPSDPPPVLLDWLPWNHTMGGNATLQLNLAVGGTTWIDDGKPLPGLFEETLRNLREISPTSFSNVPAGYAMLIAALEKDDVLARKFFANLGSISYGGAALSNDLYERFEQLAVKYTGFRIPFSSGYGATETAPTVTSVHWASERVGLLGLPLPGVQLKLVPTGEDNRYEMRVKSVVVTPGYHKQPDLTAQMLDEDGFYKIGDAVKLVDPADANQGLIFDGRVIEDFKLTSGTFVLVGTLRTAAIAAASPVLQDVVVCGQDHDYIGLLGFPNLAACRAVAGDKDVQLSNTELICHPAVIGMVTQGLARMNAAGKGSSMRVRRIVLMTEPPQVDGNEITDKGYLNQRATLQRRSSLVDRLYAGGEGVIEIS